MATKPKTSSGRRIARPDWRAVLKRSLRRAGELGGAVLLFAAMLFLALALVSYHQTDPSPSTATGGEVMNWMGAAGAFAAERALFLFGPVAVLFLPLLYVFARKLWRLAEEEDGLVEQTGQRWWRPTGILLFAMALIATVLSLTFTQPGGSLPASMGGISGLLGARALHAIAALMPEVARSWTVLGFGSLCLLAGAILAGRVFAVDWRILLTLPGKLRRVPALAGEAATPLARTRSKQEPAAKQAVPAQDTRKGPQIVDPTRPVKPAQLSAKSKQGDLFEEYELPSLDLLRNPPKGGIRRSTSFRSSAMRACLRRCSMISTSRARSAQCAAARSSPCTSWSRRRASRRHGLSALPTISPGT